MADHSNVGSSYCSSTGGCACAGGEQVADTNLGNDNTDLVVDEVPDMNPTEWRFVHASPAELDLERKIANAPRTFRMVPTARKPAAVEIAVAPAAVKVTEVPMIDQSTFTSAEVIQPQIVETVIVEPAIVDSIAAGQTAIVESVFAESVMVESRPAETNLDDSEIVLDPSETAGIESTDAASESSESTEPATAEQLTSWTTQTTQPVAIADHAVDQTNWRTMNPQSVITQPVMFEPTLIEADGEGME